MERQGSFQVLKHLKPKCSCTSADSRCSMALKGQLTFRKLPLGTEGKQIVVSCRVHWNAERRGRKSKGEAPRAQVGAVDSSERAGHQLCPRATAAALTCCLPGVFVSGRAGSRGEMGFELGWALS